MSIDSRQLRTAGVIGAMAAVFTLGLWLPLHLQQGRLHDRLAQAQSRVELDRARAQGLAKTAAQVQTLEASIRSQTKRVPADSEQGELLRMLSTELAGLRVTDRKVQVKPVIGGAEFSVLPISVEFTGPFGAFQGLLERLDAMPRLLRVTELRVDGNPADPAKPLTVRMEIAAFFAAQQMQQLEEEP